jgi:hypothetical protein
MLRLTKVVLQHLKAREYRATFRITIAKLSGRFCDISGDCDIIRNGAIFSGNGATFSGVTTCNGATDLRSTPSHPVAYLFVLLYIKISL